MSDTAPQLVLCLNGGGVKGLASLLILDDLWKYLGDVFEQQGLSHKFSPEFRPCELFTLIGGTSTGAIIAIMLGVLRMTIGECIDAYEKLSECIFKTPMVILVGRVMMTGYRYSSYRLRKVIEKFLDDKLGAGGRDAPLWDKNCANSTCKTVIATIPTSTFEPILLRSWSKSDAGPENGWGLLDAILAATAAPTFFAVHKAEGCEYLDAAYKGCNNPAELILNESRRLSDHHIKPALFLDVGTGRPGDAYREGIWGWVKHLKVCVTTSEPPSKAIMPQLNQRTERIYFRLCIDKGMENIHVPDYKKLSDIKKAADYYCKDDIHLRRKYLLIGRIVNDVIMGTYTPVFDVCNIGANIEEGCLKDAKSWTFLGIDLRDEFIPCECIPRSSEYYTLRYLKETVSSIGHISDLMYPAKLLPIQILGKVLENLYEDLNNHMRNLKKYGKTGLLCSTASSSENIDKTPLSKILNEIVLISAYHCWVWRKDNLRIAEDLEPDFQRLLRSAERQRIREDCVEQPTCRRLWLQELDVIKSSKK
ncbi:acyl transferase/acyl hydrolase/lysophospholipase [Geopyxis carbonaria]|nr:acyl transferase/acyl hydrolase/lysophospholipase [Geopyxis carbonaria]